MEIELEWDYQLFPAIVGYRPTSHLLVTGARLRFLDNHLNAQTTFTDSQGIKLTDRVSLSQLMF